MKTPKQCFNDRPVLLCFADQGFQKDQGMSDVREVFIAFRKEIIKQFPLEPW
jgi:hypothetical protein